MPSPIDDHELAQQYAARLVEDLESEAKANSEEQFRSFGATLEGNWLLAYWVFRLSRGLWSQVISPLLAPLKPFVDRHLVVIALSPFALILAGLVALIISDVLDHLPAESRARMINWLLVVFD
jgi:hypothetical protein